MQEAGRLNRNEIPIPNARYPKNMIVRVQPLNRSSQSTCMVLRNTAGLFNVVAHRRLRRASIESRMTMYAPFRKILISANSPT